MATNVTHRTAANGAAAHTAADLYTREYVAPPTGRSMAAQVITMLSTLAGVWVAISPWFLTLGPRATANDLIVGLVVAALGLFAIAGVRGFMGLQTGNVLLGTWLIISPFILAAKFSVGAPMYWSNCFAGATIIVFALAAFAGMRRVPVR
ncbi:MAG: SPW repeat protein [Micromonosporaceae bacterium]